MDVLSGLTSLLTISTVVLLIVGACLGLVIGALPGLGPVFVLTILLPITIHFSTINALVMLVAAYTAAVYGGAITAVVFNVPGHPGNIATTFDGPAMARQGRAGEAVVAIAVAGVVGGLVATAVFVFVAPVITNLALKLQPVDFFMLAVFGLSMVAAASGRRVVPGLVLGGVGLLISTIGPDVMTGKYRFTFGVGFLQQNGIPLALVAVGLFAFGSAFLMIEEGWRASPREQGTVTLKGGIKRGLRAAIEHPIEILRSGVLGTVIGIIPGLGITLSNIAAYLMESRFKRSAEWGKGYVVGVMAPEAADSATLISELIPAFTLGIPGAATSALMLEALMLHGVTAGPGFFNGGKTVNAFFLSIPLAMVVVALLGLMLAPVVVRMAQIPTKIVAPAIIVIASVGAYVVNGSVFDIVLAMIFGVVGYAILKLRLPLAPLIMGTLLGPLAEENFDRVRILDQTTHSVAFFQPLALVLAAISLTVFTTPLLGTMLRSRRPSSTPTSHSGTVEGAGEDAETSALIASVSSQTGTDGL